MSAQACQCHGVPGLITAAPAPRLIAKGSMGISVWTKVLLNKFLFSRATYNLCIDYAYRGLPIAPGTLTDGLQRIAPLFKPLLARLVEKQLTEALFHNDETGWKVFEAIEGKVGYRWYLWVTQSPAFISWLMSEEHQQLLAKPVPIGTGLAQQEKQSLIPKLPP
jgi:transposase